MARVMPNQPTNSEGLSLLTEEGDFVAETMRQLAIGRLTLSDLGDNRFFRESDGTLCLMLDEESWHALDEDAIEESI